MRHRRVEFGCALGQQVAGVGLGADCAVCGLVQRHLVTQLHEPDGEAT